jgi:hypothetical protein
MGARRQLLDAGLSLSLATPSMWLRFLFHAWCTQPLFDDWQSPRVHSGFLVIEPESQPFTKLAVDKEPLPVQARLRG